jgi:hypothetical protein
MLVKPFSLPELILRVKKQTGQAHDRPDHRILYAKGIELDLTARQVKVRDESVSLTATEFRLLECLMINQTRALSMEQLRQSVWSKTWQNGERVVDVPEVLPEAKWQRCYVHFLRNALDHVPRKKDDDVLTELRWIYERRNVEEARRDLAAW